MQVKFEMPGLNRLQELAETFLKPLKGYIDEMNKCAADNSTVKTIRVAAAFFALAGTGIYLGCAAAFHAPSAALAATGLFMFAIAVLPCEHRASAIAQLAQDLFGLCFRCISQDHQDPVTVMASQQPLSAASPKKQDQRMPVGTVEATALPSEEKSARVREIE